MPAINQLRKAPSRSRCLLRSHTRSTNDRSFVMKNLAFWIGAAAFICGAVAIASGTEDEGPMPDFDRGVTWLNSAPLRSKALRGKVVLVNFWTYSCINSLRELPYVKAWAAKYKDAG